MAEMNAPKLIIIGLDGATFDVLDPYVKKGVLPNIERMMRNGARGTLESAIPPVTGPSWVSFMTGVGPGKHGVFDFVKRIPGSVKRQPITFRDIKCKTIWGLLDEAGRTMGIVNLPVSYPAPEIRGFVIPGLLTPSAEGEFAHPDGLMAEIRGAVGDYVLDVWWQHYGEEAERFLDDLLLCTDKRIRTIRYLMENKAWDVFMGVFIGTDRIQHYLWQYIHPQNTETLSEAERRLVMKIEAYFRRVDDFFGMLIEKYGHQADVIVISDHGFGPLKKKMYINRWLAEKGYLSVDGRRVGLLGLKKGILSVLRPIVRKLDRYELRKKFGERFKMAGRMSAYSFLDCIDWRKTLAYSASNTEQGLYLNLRGREPEGAVLEANYERVRDEVIHLFEDLRDPETGNKVGVRIFKREELYNGPCVSDAPDIVLFLNNGEWLIDVQLKGDVHESAGWHTGFGTHRIEGTLIGYGPNISKGRTLDGARIVDVAPTVLYQQGLSIPEEMDGRPLLTMFNEEVLKSRPVSHSGAGETLAVAQSGAGELSQREMQEVEEKLKGLGYL